MLYRNNDFIILNLLLLQAAKKNLTDSPMQFEKSVIYDKVNDIKSIRSFVICFVLECCFFVFKTCLFELIEFFRTFLRHFVDK